MNRTPTSRPELRTRRLRLFNTLARSEEEFVPIEAGKVRLYTCGPTVYDYAHIGNLRTYIFEDVLRRTLEAADFDVRHVMNITDVGHLESDADLGEDKLVIASRREHASPWDLARLYEKAFFEDCAALNILPPVIQARATDHIPEIIEFIQALDRQGHVYVVDGNVYFDIQTYPPYAELARLRLDQPQEWARVDPDPRKKNPLDFVLWFSQSKFPNQIMQWDAPWGTGFPGWHIECSVLASKYLGDRIDIHCGGIDHITIHHTNERAQSEARFGHRWVNIWMHAEFLILDEQKMSKSGGGFVTLRSIKDRGFEPVHYRYFCLGALYRHPVRFSWEALSTARSSLEGLKNRVVSWKLRPAAGSQRGADATRHRERFWDAMSQDLHTPAALAVVWEVAKDAALGSQTKLELITEFDRILGLGVQDFERPQIPSAMEALIREREAAREAKDWKAADAIRNRLLEHGIQVKDSQQGTDWYTQYDD